MRKNRLRILRFTQWASALVLLSLSITSCSRGNGRTIELSGLTMGTTWSVKVVADNPTAQQRETIWDLVNSQLNTVNERMSHYLDTSELSRFNASGADTPFSISSETVDVLREAIRIGMATHGALDITIGPLVDAWGFGPPGEPPNSPSDEEIERLLTLTGLDHLDLDAGASAISKDNAGVQVNLASIAKGYGVDRVAATLLAEGYHDIMVEIGGEVRVNGHREDGQPWRLAVEQPQTDGGRSFHAVLALDQGSMATSGDYRFFREVEGRRISHIIDPRTGRPVEHSLASVTVYEDSSCTKADGYATALLVLGPDEGFELAEKLDLAALFLVRNDRGQFEERITHRFEKLLNTLPQ